MSVRHQLLRLLLAGKIGPVLGSLTVLADQLGDNKLLNEAVHLSERYRRLHQAYSDNLIDTAAYRREVEQLRQSLQFVVEQLP